MTELCSVCGHSRYFHVKGGVLDPKDCIVGGLAFVSHTFATSVNVDLSPLLPKHIFNAEPIAYFPLNNDVLDKGGLGADGTVTGTTTFTTGKVAPTTNGAFDFDGASRITLASEGKFDFENTDPFSISFWAKWTSIANEILVCKIDPTGAIPGYEVNVQSDGKIQFQRRGATGIAKGDTTSSFNDGAFHHIVVTCAGGLPQSNNKIYVDGVLQTLTNLTDALAGSMLHNVAVVIAARNDATLELTGQIDNVVIWDYELTSVAVAALFNSGNGVVVLA